MNRQYVPGGKAEEFYTTRTTYRLTPGPAE